MPSQVRALLKQLQEELENTEISAGVDKNTLQELQTTLHRLSEQLSKMGSQVSGSSTADEEPSPAQTMIDLLEESLVTFEGNHPRASGIARDLIQSLERLGI